MNTSTTRDDATRTRRAKVPTPWGMFFRGFLKHPVMVGSIIPSSDRLIEKMLAPVDWAKCKVFVEYGPGVGTFCRPILEKMAPDARLIAIDTNPDFIAYLDATILDSRFTAVEGAGAGDGVAQGELDGLTIHPSMRLRIDHFFEERAQPYLG